MRWVAVLESISLNGFFCRKNGGLRWPHHDPDDEEWSTARAACSFFPR